jgi:hypothetical protein
VRSTKYISIVVIGNLHVDNDYHSTTSVLQIVLFEVSDKLHNIWFIFFIIIFLSRVRLESLGT